MASRQTTLGLSNELPLTLADATFGSPAWLEVKIFFSLFPVLNRYARLGFTSNIEFKILQD
jgi:hypothetical protein